jgi:hypothetical protein
LALLTKLKILAMSINPNTLAWWIYYPDNDLAIRMTEVIAWNWYKRKPNFGLVRTLWWELKQWNPKRYQRWGWFNELRLADNGPRWYGSTIKCRY